MLAFLREHRNNIIFSIFGPVFGTISGVIYYALAPNGNPVYGVVVAMFITLLFHVGFTTVIVNQKTDTINKKIDDTKKEFINYSENSLSTRFKISRVLESDIGFRLDIAINKYDTIKNTYVNQSHYRGRSTKFGNDSVLFYEKFLSQNREKRWADITTYQDIVDGRYEEIKMGKLHGKHTVHVISGNTDIINFIIFEKDGKLCEMYFGWISGVSDRMEIFWTAEKPLLRLFADYFRLLQLKSIEILEVDYRSGNGKIPSKASNLLGTWISAAIVSGVDSADKLAMYSIFKIYIENGTWKIDMDIYNKNRGNRIESRIKSAQAVPYDGGVFFESERENLFNHSIERGFTTFKPADTSRDVMFGTYTTQNVRRVNHNKAIKIGSVDTYPESASWDEARQWLVDLMGR